MRVAENAALGAGHTTDSTDSTDELDELDELDAPSASAPPARPRRSQSRARARRAKVASGVSKASRPATNVSAALDQRTTQRVQSVAESVARQVCVNNSSNLDLDCKVFGVTHRGGFKLRVVHLEEMTSSMVDRWRAVCLTRGYASTISFDVTASEALIVATPILKVASWASWCGNACGNPCAKLDPLNAVFVGALALNTLRHALGHFA